MSRERIAAVVVVMCPDASLRRVLHLALADAGYAMVEAPTHAAVLSQLRAAARPMVVVVANLTLHFRAETAFFGQVAADAGLARQHRFMLLSTAADGLPDELCAPLHRLDVRVLRLPARLDDLLAAVAHAAGRLQTQTQTEDTPAG